MDALPPATLSFGLRVAGAADLTDRIRQLELVSDEGELQPFEAGAHIDVALGNGLIRSYSLANDPSERHRYVIAVLREPEGLGSGWLHDRVGVGDRLEVAGPRNAFSLQDGASEHVLIAGGVGITPIRSMVHRLIATKARFRVIYCTRTAEETAFRDELLASLGPRLLLHHDGGDLRQSLDLAATLGSRPDGAHAYVCGPRGLIAAARAATADWPADTVHVELFASPTVIAAAPAGADFPFEVVLARSGQVLRIPADRSILDMILAAGVKAPYVCREGWCGNCRTGLLGGLADHRDDVLEDDERAAQDCIHTCISRALPGERLILDR